MGLMLRRRAMLLIPQTGGLPDTYQEVEYISSDGSAYLDSGMTVSKGDIFTFTFEISSARNNIVPYGWRWDGTYANVKQLYINANSGNRRIIAGWNADRTGNDSAFAVSTRTTIVFDSDAETITVNGAAFEGDYSFASGAAFNGEGSSEYNPYLFAINFKGSAAGIATNTKIYGYSVKRDGAFVQKLIPCYRKSDGEIGMYDTVSGTFYTNQGTGTFSKGADVSLPTEYQEVEYIENSGGQYIDTGIVGRSGIRFETRLSISRIRGGSPLAGCYGNTRFYLLVQNANGNIGTSYVTTYYSTTPLAVGTPYDIGVDMYPSAQAIRVDGETVYTGTISNDINTGKNIYLFGYNFGGYDSRFPVYYKLYKAQFYYNDVLVGNFVPCYRKADGVIGLYDLVSATFFTNSGSGTFTKGADI